MMSVAYMSRAYRGDRAIDATEIAAIVDQFNNILTVISGHAALMEGSLVPGDPYQEDLTEINASLSRAAAVTRRLSQLAEEGEIAG
jgi:signal transduction histidine kinase